MSWADLAQREQDAFIKLLEQPSLWAFAVVAAKLGMEQAIGALDREGHTPEVVNALRSGGWGPQHLPRRHTIDALLLSVRLVVPLERDPKASLRGVVEELGVALPDAHAALRVLESYAGTRALAGVR